MLTFLVFQNCDSCADAFKGVILAADANSAGEQLSSQLRARGFKHVEFYSDTQSVYFTAYHNTQERDLRNDRICNLYPNDPNPGKGGHSWSTNYFQLVESSKFPVF